MHLSANMFGLNGWEKNTLFHSKAIYYLLFLINTKNAFILSPFSFVLIPKFPALAHMSIVLFERSLVLCSVDICSLSTMTIWASSQENLSLGFPSKQVSDRSTQLQRLVRKSKFHLSQV